MSHHRRLATLFSIGVVLASTVRAQCLAPDWSSVNEFPGFNSTAEATTVWDPDGNGPAAPVLVVGGDFRFAGTTAATRIATWNGACWQPLGTGLPGPSIQALSVYNGELIAAGDFWSTNPAAGNVARWDGASWQPLGSGLTIPGSIATVRALTIYNGQLIAGGRFTTADGAPAMNVARWNGVSWQALGAGVGTIPPSFPLVGDIVHTLAVYGNELIAGGVFTIAGGVSANSVARWNGTSWLPLGAGVNSQVFGLGNYNGELIATGSFTMAGGLPAARIASWNGSSWQTLGAGIGSAGISVTSYNGGIAVGGSFTTAGGVPAERIAFWNGASWQALGAGMGGINSGVNGLTVFGGELIAAGRFTTADGAPAMNVARWNGSAWHAFGTAGINNQIMCFLPHGDDLLAGGTFTMAGNAVAGRVAKWNGSTWQPLGGGLDDQVNALTLYNGEVIAGGYFTSAGGVTVNHVARWDGSTWLPLGSGTDSLVLGLTVYNGLLIACGYFSTAGGVPASRIAAWNGSSWQPLGAGLGAISISAVTTHNGSLIAEDWIWNGSTWQLLSGGISGLVAALTSYNGDLIAAGGFTTAGGMSANRIARWDGVSWLPLGDGVTAAPVPLGPEVRALGVYDGSLVAGGLFSVVGGNAAECVARWDGVSWHAMEKGLTDYGPGGGVRALATWHGALFAGGSCYGSGSLGSPYFARWSSALPFVAFSQPAGSATGLEIKNRWLVPGCEYFNIFSLEICGSGPGTGPYGGLCASDPGFLLSQVVTPVGTEPFHFQATGTTVTFGPYLLPIGLSFDALTIASIDLNTGVLGCVCPAQRYTVY